MSELSLKNITKIYGKNILAIDDLSLEIANGEFVVIIGPSGCGKSTLLRIIAGLDETYSGDVFIDLENVNGVLPKDRNISMVFQNYSLYPHMTVYQNIAFGLQIRKIPPNEIDTRVKNVAELLGISDLLTRKPKTLSGGQMQRVCLARAIIKEPDIFLLDEPLSNVDAKFRNELRQEISNLHKKLQTTFLYVTHDQTEALTMGDKIVLLDKGKVQQVGPAKEVYETPNNFTVATFFDLSPVNYFRIKLILKEDKIGIILGNSFLPITLLTSLISNEYLDKEVSLCIRAEDISLAENGMKATIESTKQIGSQFISIVKIDGLEDEIAVKVENTSLQIGQEVFLQFTPKKCFLFDIENGNAIIDYSIQ